MASALVLAPCGRTADWVVGPGYRARTLTVPAAGQTGFTSLNAAETGLQFTNVLSKACYTTNQTFLNGSGVALGDIDGDGLPDIYLCSLQGPNALYRNLGGWRFQNITADAGVARPNFAATSCALVDVDGDGHLDLITSSIGQGTWVALNNGKGQFRPSAQPPLNLNRAAMSMAVADIDGDGDLDLYIANYRMISIRDQPNTRFRVSTASGQPVVVQVNGRPVTEPDLVGRFELDPNGKVVEHGESPALFLNDGQGRFAEASFTDGRFLDEDGKPLKSPPYDWGLSVAFRDLNGDRAPDIYACNDFNSPDRVWLNDGHGRFRAVPRLTLRTTSLFSMGLDFADLNRDGFDELFVADMLSRDHRKRQNQLADILPPVTGIGEIDNRPQYSRNTLFLNRGDGTYAEIGQFSHVYASEWSWSPVFLDVDLDGYEDLLIVTGNERDSMNADVTHQLNARIAGEKMSLQQVLDLKNRFARLELPNLAFRNRRDLTFEEVSAAWGFDTSGVSQGMALADLDGDGDLDVVINNLNGPARLYRNNSVAPRLAVQLKGTAGNSYGIGARVSVLHGPAPQSQEMMSAGRYLSSDAPGRTFAASSANEALTIRVDWRRGNSSLLTNLAPNCLYEIDEATAPAAPPPNALAGSSLAALPQVAMARAAPAQPLFEDVTARLNHTHHEAPFDDFARQPLLQRRLSQLGPGIAWFDFDGDGQEDLIVPSGAGGRLALLKNLGPAGFAPVQGPLASQAVTRDQTTPLCWSSASGQVTLLVGSANYEDGLAIGPVARQYDIAGQKVDERLPGQPSSTGPLALAKAGAGEEWLLFVGGRVVPGRYPEAASSMLLRSSPAGWQLDEPNTRALRQLGMASAAVWSDLDQDGTPELIVACEAGPIRVFRFRGGALSEATAEMGLAKLLGFWNGVATGDFDGDGQLDIVATNWGWNQRYHDPGNDDLRLYYGDFLRNGTIEVIEAYVNREMKKAVPFAGLNAMARALPFLRDRVAGYEAFGLASVEEILGDRASLAKVAPVNTLASMVFFNRAGRFQPVALPLEAQLAPGFGICVGDMDGDGLEDIFLSQNFFALGPEIPRMDAGRGVWLKGMATALSRPSPDRKAASRFTGNNADAPWEISITTVASTWPSRRMAPKPNSTATRGRNPACGSASTEAQPTRRASARSSAWAQPTIGDQRERFGLARVTGLRTVRCR
ncbi:MAG: VCBS repeat-containing protein [Verrucomicrobiota bacterium]